MCLDARHGSGSCTDTVISLCTHRCSVALTAVVGVREGRASMQVHSQVSIALFKQPSVHRCVHNQVTIQESAQKEGQAGEAGRAGHAGREGRAAAGL